MTPQDLLMLSGNFIYVREEEFFLDVPGVGNFIWDVKRRIIRYTSETFNEYVRKYGMDYGMDKGNHVLGAYLGLDIIFTKATVATLSRF